MMCHKYLFSVKMTITSRFIVFDIKVKRESDLSKHFEHYDICFLKNSNSRKSRYILYNLYLQREITKL